MQLNKENTSEEKEALNTREEIEKYTVHWRWFVLGVLLTLIGAYIYLSYATPKYSARASIMIKDNQKSGFSKELETFKDLGVMGGATNNTDNEIEIIKSRKIIGDVVDSLNLTVSYFIKEMIKKEEVYKKSPIKIKFLKKNPILQKRDTLFTISLLSNNKFNLKDEDDNIVSTHAFNEVVNSALGTFKVTKTDFYTKKKSSDVYVSLTTRFKTIDNYRLDLDVSLANKKSTSVLLLSLENPVKEKAEDFLNELIKQYNLDAINSKNEVSKKTINFIKTRLIEVGQGLASIQDDATNYKTKNKTTGLSKEGEIALESVAKSNEKIAEAKTELSLAKWIRESLNKESEKEELLPQNLGFSDENISKSIEKYNELVSTKERLGVNAGKKNPILVQYIREIASLKTNLKKSISNLEYSLKAKLEHLTKEASIVKSKVSKIPIIERGYIDIARQQGIFSSLYSYLLKKKEETAISLAVTVPNAKIIDVAYSSDIPVSPKRRIIYLAALLLGLLIPFAVIYLKNLLDTKVRQRKDIEEVINIPFLGDVPRSKSKEKVVIGFSDSRSSTAEAFRLIRTNLDFILHSISEQNGCKTIFLTSTTSGEGKSFVSINLSATLSLSGKRVLLLGMDLRAPKITEYLGIPERKGITNYITDSSILLDDLKFSIPEIKGLDIIASGVIPPNPAELLLNDRIKEIFKVVKKEYDYVIVDTAPVSLVTDTLLISKYADVFIYVVRANYLDKRMLVIPKTLYKENKLPNMSIILNDTDITKGYGYGYGYGQESNKPWYKKIFSK